MRSARCGWCVQAAAARSGRGVAGCLGHALLTGAVSRNVCSELLLAQLRSLRLRGARRQLEVQHTAVTRVTTATPVLRHIPSSLIAFAIFSNQADTQVSHGAGRVQSNRRQRADTVDLSNMLSAANCTCIIAYADAKSGSPGFGPFTILCSSANNLFLLSPQRPSVQDEASHDRQAATVSSLPRGLQHAVTHNRVAVGGSPSTSTGWSSTSRQYCPGCGTSRQYTHRRMNAWVALTRSCLPSPSPTAKHGVHQAGKNTISAFASLCGSRAGPTSWSAS